MMKRHSEYFAHLPIERRRALLQLAHAGAMVQIELPSYLAAVRTAGNLIRMASVGKIRALIRQRDKTVSICNPKPGMAVL